MRDGSSRELSVAKTNAEAKSPTIKAVPQRAARRLRGEGDQVSLTIPAPVWKVLHAVSRLQGTRIPALLANSLVPILSHAGVSVEEVDRFLKGTQKPQRSNEIKSEVLDQLFGKMQVG